MWVYSRPKGKTAFCFHRIPISLQFVEGVEMDRKSWLHVWVPFEGINLLNKKKKKGRRKKEPRGKKEQKEGNLISVTRNCRDESIGLNSGFIRARKGRPLSAFIEFQSRCSSRGRCGNGSESPGSTFGCLSRVSIFECNLKEIALFHIQILTVHFGVTVMESGDLKIYICIYIELFSIVVKIR
ncbi:hypothetical protein CEXT_570651 [Caerostris extrusa]|uniref:Uncharacterized protein n=1 Tax=Caerostris extrusa TaxID=172846 RepID=A0AAV4Y6C8_CAEEX|nr:hypothetical protein CEXT_570651 [Caerostris extrusa]